MGIFFTYIPYLLYGAGLQRIQTGKAAMITMVEPIVSVLVAAWMWGETFSAAGYFFAALVITGVALS
jgi:drug/metabolite transporter (DMT)-like permease